MIFHEYEAQGDLRGQHQVASGACRAQLPRIGKLEGGPLHRLALAHLMPRRRMRRRREERESRVSPVAAISGVLRRRPAMLFETARTPRAGGGCAFPASCAARRSAPLVRIPVRPDLQGHADPSPHRADGWLGLVAQSTRRE